MSDPIVRLNAALEGRYRVEREIGEGGMATVYLAHDERHDRKVALKVLKAELAAVVGAERFLAEIETTAKLTHPHILPLHDSGEADGFLYFVTPYIEGDTLRDKIDREKQLSVEEALEITKRVASALDYAHEHGVVHRDIKPGNILLSEKGEPTVADFGIALAVAQAGGGRITETGLNVGTPHYMSPEQATGDRDVDPRTDVYALGCVLYEMLTGDPPYQGSTAQAVLGQIITGKPVSAVEKRASIPPNVDAAIRKALEKLPADRFTAAQEFAKALGDPGFRHGEEAGLRDLSSELILEQVARAWYAPTGQLVYLQSDGAVLAAPFDLSALAITGGAIPLFDRVRVGGPNADMQLAADGTLLYVEGSSSGATAVQRLLVIDLEGNEEALPLDPRAIYRVSWSPDGQSVAYSRNVNPGVPHDLYTYNVTLGTTPRQLTFEGANQWGVFSPDGNRVAFSSGREGTNSYDLFVKNLNDDTPARSIITLEGNQLPTQWPSDTLIVFESGSGGPGNRDLWMLNLSDPDNPKAEAYLSSESRLSSIKVSRDGTLAAYHSNESGAREVYIRSFPEPGERTPVSQGGGVAPSWSPDGNTVYYWRNESPFVLTFMAARIQRQPTPVVLSRDSLFTREVVATSGGNVVAYDLNAEGDRLIVAQSATGTVSEGGSSEPDRLILVQNFFEELRQVVPE